MQCSSCKSNISESAKFCPYCGESQIEAENDAEARSDAFYEKALIEVEQGEQEKSLWARALVTAEGDEQRAKVVYIKIRVERLEKQYQEQQRVFSRESSSSSEAVKSDSATKNEKEEVVEWPSASRNEGAMTGFRNDPESLLLLSSRRGNILGIVDAIEFGADVNYKNKHGATALYLAVTNDETDTARFLLEAGAKRNIPYYNGETAAGYVEKKGSREMRDLFGEKL